MTTKQKTGIIAKVNNQVVFLSSFNLVPNPYFIVQTPKELRDRLPHLEYITPNIDTFSRPHEKSPGSYERSWYINFTTDIDKARLEINKYNNSFDIPLKLLADGFCARRGEYLESVKLDNKKINPRDVENPQEIIIEETILRSMVNCPF